MPAGVPDNCLEAEEGEILDDDRAPESPTSGITPMAVQVLAVEVSSDDDEDFRKSGEVRKRGRGTRRTFKSVLSSDDDEADAGRPQKVARADES
jgi:hypothetical protein